MDPRRITRLSYEELKQYTDNFSKENYIGKFQFGKVYRGKIEWMAFGGTQYVTVKMWEVPEIYNYYRGDNEERMMDEIVLLRHEKVIHHPGMVKLYGYCHEGDHLGVVYDFKPLDTVYNFLLKDDFTWLQRIKVALGFACLLKFLHARNPLYEPFMIRNLDAAHIMLDEEYNPKLIDFGMITGGIFPDRTIYIHYVYGSYGYVDPSYDMIGGWTEKSDVFAFGIILLGLIAKRVFTEEDREANAPFVHQWARSKYGSDTGIKLPKSWLVHGSLQAESNESDTGIKLSKLSLVHGSLQAEPGFFSTDGANITRLAMQCVEYYPEDRPTMKEVVRHLLKLQVVKHHAGFLGMDQALGGHDTK
uniref:Protein kinase domain-containing protein n=1 Tax=Davidia involucrata TaxID=16924 RepID=A0A5B7BMY7_DAVIN